MSEMKKTRILQRPTMGNLCAGIGGLDLAVEAVYGATPAWHAEIEPAPAQVHERHWPDIPNLGDITTIDWAIVQPVNVLTAGYPCQPFSLAGRRLGVDDARHLWPYVADAIRVLRPGIVVLENVAGHLSLGFGVVLGDLAEAGYDAEWCCVRASDIGAPHRRERVFIVATDTDSWGFQGRTELNGEPANHPSDRHPQGGHADRRCKSPANTDIEGPQGPQSAQRHDLPAGSRRQPAVNTDSATRGHLGSASETLREPGTVERLGRRDQVAWGKFESAIRRWEWITGRPAPNPVDDRGKLSPELVEWMMGYPQGWTEGAKRTERLKMLGNAVVPAQAEYALRLFASEIPPPVP